MKHIQITLYHFNELSPNAQQNALEEFRNAEVDHTDWYDFIFEDFVAIAATLGVKVNVKNIFFSGFHSQGSGSAFASYIDTPNFISAITTEAWKTDYPDLNLSFQPCPCDPRVLALIKSTRIDAYASTATHRKSNQLVFGTHYQFDADNRYCTDNIETELEKLDTWIENYLHKLNNYLYRRLSEAYDHLTSDQVVMDFIISNNYLFTANGKSAGDMLNLSD